MIVTLGTTPAIQRVMVYHSPVKIDAVNRTGTVMVAPAGKAINAAHVARALCKSSTEQVCTIGFLGQDDAGSKLMTESLTAKGIAHSFVNCINPGIRVCVTVVDVASHTCTELVEESRPVSDGGAYDELLVVLRRTLEANANVRALVLAGSMPPDGPPDFYSKCVSIALSIRPNLACIVDAKGESLLLACQERPLLIKPNLAELQATLTAAGCGNLSLEESDDAAIFAGMKRLLAVSGAPQWILVTRGPRPVLLAGVDGCFTLSVPTLSADDLINPIGSGDATAAGIAMGIERGYTVLEAARLGVACGVANATTILAGHVEATTVERLLEHIHLTRVE
jgi:fructose-1-phosphate kinase PfkB-like protein